MESASAKTPRSEIPKPAASLKVKFAARATPPQTKDATPVTWLCYMDPFCWSISEV
jgi:hypothetical protein